MPSFNSIITGSGHYLPTETITSDHFLHHSFYNPEGTQLQTENATIVDKFYKITGIKERKHATDNLMASDLGFFAAERALENANLDKEQLDYIIVAHNFGDICPVKNRVDMVPTLAARIKEKLAIENPYCVAYDLPFGCPGWVEGVIQANYYIKAGDAKHIMVIGTETLSRVCDPHDRDSMIYADGAGAVIFSASEEEDAGVLAHLTRSDTLKHAQLLWMGPSYNKEHDQKNLYIKMEGRKLYEYALKTVPGLVKKCMEKAGIGIDQVKKVLIHQANEKMDEAMLYRLCKLYGTREMPENIMPMIIEKMGNNSVATVPVLLDMIRRNQLKQHQINKGDHIIFASVGAGMNCNAIVYKSN